MGVEDNTFEMKTCHYLFPFLYLMFVVGFTRGWVGRKEGGWCTFDELGLVEGA